MVNFFAVSLVLSYGLVGLVAGYILSFYVNFVVIMVAYYLVVVLIIRVGLGLSSGWLLLWVWSFALVCWF